MESAGLSPMTQFADLSLPTGLWVDGTHLRHVRVRGLSADEDGFLLEKRNGLGPIARVTSLLARCLGVPGDPRPAQESAAAMTVGDREALLLAVRRATFGEELACALRCPDAGCGAPLEVVLRASDLMLEPYADAAPRYEAEIADGDHRLQVTFRLPTGSDQEAAAPLAMVDPQAAARSLAERCALDVRDPTGIPVDHLSDVAVIALGEAMASRDPQAEIELDLTCPACGSAFVDVFETGTFLLQELDGYLGRVTREIHVLAMNYHWSEADILALTPERRARYLGLLAEDNMLGMTP